MEHKSDQMIIACLAALAAFVLPKKLNRDTTDLPPKP